MPINKNKAGLALGVLLGAWHLLWSIFVLTGVAQWILNWVYYLHFLNNPFKVADFSVGRALGLIIVTAVAGYIFGWVFAFLWNWVHRS